MMRFFTLSALTCASTAASAVSLKKTHDFEFSRSGFPHSEDKRAGISKFFQSLFTLLLHIPCYAKRKTLSFGFGLSFSTSLQKIFTYMFKTSYKCLWRRGLSSIKQLYPCHLLCSCYIEQLTENFQPILFSKQTNIGTNHIR